MDFQIPCETFARLAKIAETTKSNRPDYLKSVFIEYKDGDAFAVATNGKIAAIEYLGKVATIMSAMEAKLPEFFALGRPVLLPRSNLGGLVRHGEDATVVAWGPLVPVALAAAQAAEEDGRSVEVIDLRSLSPIDFDTLEDSVRRTGRLVVAHEAPTFGGLGGEIAARLTERAFYSLEAPVLRVGAYHLPYPVAAVEDQYVPDLDRILEALDRSFAY